MLTYIIMTISLLLFAQSLFSVYLMLYSWQQKDTLEASKGPKQLIAPELSFTILLPARNEEAVIYDTIQKICQTNYPPELLEVVVICHQDDRGTIAEAQRALNELNSWRVRIMTFANPPINKPHGLNVGLHGTFNEIVAVFDAEDDIHADIFHVINTVMRLEKVRIVQAGVQLMNFGDHWFSPHNCMEYFFWFKSRLHFHARVGMIPLGGNTVFIHRTLLEKIGGWDEECLTEDAEIGLRLSSLGEPIRVLYEQRYTTREETPAGTASFIRQRTRWQQGFLQVLWKGTWLSLPHFHQRFLAFYTLSYPFTQAIFTLLWLPAIFSMLWLKLSVTTSMISFLPLYSLFFQFLTTVVGTYIFTREYNLKFPWHLPLTMTLTFLPFQWLQGISSLRVVYRVIVRQENWEKTLHLGAHRNNQLLPRLRQTIIEEQDTVVLTHPDRITAPVPIVTPSGSLSQVDYVHASRGTIASARPLAAFLAKTQPIVLEEQDIWPLQLDDDEATVPRGAIRNDDDEATVPRLAIRKASQP